MQYRKRLQLMREREIRCENCVFFDFLAGSVETGDYDGVCLYYPPSAVVVDGQVESYRSYVTINDFCAFYEPMDVRKEVE